MGFVDVDFTLDARYVPGYSAIAPLRNKAFAGRFGDSVNVIPRSQWRELADAIASDGGGAQQLTTRIYDQGNEGSCVSNATCQAHEITQARQCGRDAVVHLSAISLYKRCGSSANSGSMVDENWDELRDRGVLPLDNAANQARFAHTMPNTGFGKRYPTGWEETAAKFRGVEAFVIESTDEFVSALLLQYPVVYGRDGHSICACDYVYRGGAGFAMYANSWGDWGENGFGYDSMSKISSGSDWAFAVRSCMAG